MTGPAAPRIDGAGGTDLFKSNESRLSDGVNSIGSARTNIREEQGSFSIQAGKILKAKADDRLLDRRR